MHQPVPQLHLAVTLPPPAYFRIFSFDRPVILLAWRLVVIFFASYELFGLADIGQRRLEESKTGKKWEAPSVIIPSNQWDSFCGFSIIKHVLIKYRFRIIGDNTSLGKMNKDFVLFQQI
jgi:hypothetical protein